MIICAKSNLIVVCVKVGYSMDILLSASEARRTLLAWLAIFDALADGLPPRFLTLRTCCSIAAGPVGISSVCNCNCRMISSNQSTVSAKEADEFSSLASSNTR